MHIRNYGPLALLLSIASIPLAPASRAILGKKMELYAGMVSHMDSQIGKLMAYLKSTGEYDNTLVFFLSDNGPEGSDYADAQLWLL